MRLIDADVYAEKIRKKQNECGKIIGEAKTQEEWEYWDGIYMTFVEAKLTLDNTPTVDAVQVVHGHWIEHDIDEDVCTFLECSVCGAHIHMCRKNCVFEHENYCPHCGANMMEGGEQDGNNEGMDSK